MTGCRWCCACRKSNPHVIADAIHPEGARTSFFNRLRCLKSTRAPIEPIRLLTRLSNAAKYGDCSRGRSSSHESLSTPDRENARALPLTSLSTSAPLWRAHSPMTIYGRLPPQGDLLGSAASMHEFIRPVAGAIALRALMGVRSLWPYNAIGLGGLVVGQAFKQRSVPTSHQIHLAFGCRLTWIAVSPRSRGHILFFSSQQDPGDPRSLVGEHDKRAIEPSLGRQLPEPLGSADHCVSPVGTLPRVRRGSSVAAGNGWRVGQFRRAAAFRRWYTVVASSRSMRQAPVLIGSAVRR